MKPSALLHFDNLELDIQVRAFFRHDAEPWFIHKDVCDNLAIANSKDAFAELDDDEKGVVSAAELSSKVGNTDLRIPNRGLQAVNEAGLYRLIFKSRKDEAKKFQKWVTSELLPAIRRHLMEPAPRPGELNAEMLALVSPRVRREMLLEAIDIREAEIIQLRAQADLAQVIPGQMTVHQWWLLQGFDPIKGGAVASMSNRCRLLAMARGIEIGRAKVIDHCGQITRLSRGAFTFPESILIEVCGEAA